MQSVRKGENQSDVRTIKIRCEMTPTSSGGEEQISISGGSQSPI